MRFIVDLNKCQDQVQCVFAAPQRFAVDDDGRLALRGQANGAVFESEVIPEDEIDSIEEAVMICPVQAISIEP
jgi:ferredoxin